MGTIKNAVYKVDNGTDFDEIHFKTKASQVFCSDGKTVESQLGDLVNQPTVRVYNTNDVSIASEINTLLTFNSETFDTANMFSSGLNTRLTCVKPGTYLIIAYVRWLQNGTGMRELKIFLNGSANNEIGGVTAGALAGTVRQNVATLYKLNINDYIEAKVYQNSGASVSIMGSFTGFMAIRVGD